MGGSGLKRGIAVVAALIVVTGCGGNGDSSSSAAARTVAECGQRAAHADTTRQTRAMWIATVGDADWPTAPGQSAARQQARYRHLLDMAERLNLNTVYVQIRPSADAFYPSPYEPWSEYLTGRQGGDPGYDPLRFLVAEAHARGLEFHAWFNPYRVSTRPDRARLAPGGLPRRHPDWVHRYGDALWYDPGRPEVRDLISRVVLDVVRRYDIDGVHLDDYFYPYPIPGKRFPDQATFKRYGAGFTGIGDWRRHNVDLLVQGLSTQIHQAKPWVKFGISPFGVWRNKKTDPAGSATSALQSYDDIYADSRRWVRSGWVDYIAPQLYWPVGFGTADYRTLVAWWAAQVSGTPVQLVIGQAAYQAGTGPLWKDPAELSRHLAIDARYPQVSGDAFFSARDLEHDRGGFATRLVRDHYTRPTIIPITPRQDGVSPAAPTRLEARAGRLSWRGTGAAGYAVYRAPAGGPPCIIPDGRLLLKVVGGDVHTATDTTAEPGKTYTYYVTALDRQHRQSPTARGANVTLRRG